MNRSKKGVMPTITREMYKNIKKLDRADFETFCRELYECGVEDDRASVPGIDVGKVYEVIEGVKGIGPKRLEEIKAAIEAAFSNPK